MNSENIPCPACAGGSFDQLIDFGRVPRSGVFLSRPDEGFSTIHLSFEYCTRCALLRQRAQDESSHDYTHVARSTTRQLPAYAFHLADSIRLQGIDPGRLIVEVGANDGAFMDLLVKVGFTNVVGIEPSHACAKASIEKGHRIEITHLDEQVAATLRERYGGASAVICRHTLEHVPDPAGFLAAMKNLLSAGGLLFIEVPNAQAILHDFRGHELWDEHLHILTPENLASLVRRAGFNVTNTLVWPHCGTTNILLWARLGDQPSGNADFTTAPPNDLDLCRQFERRWHSFRNKLAGSLQASPKPIAAIGASHPQSNYLLFTGLGDQVACLVDDDPAKAGHYVPIPQPAPVVSTSQLLEGSPPATVIRTAFGYEDWMDSMLAPFVTRNVRIVRPYETTFLISL